MEFATSLSTGKTYEAAKVSYAQVKALKLVCPVCKEKVFKRVRRIPHETHMFAHHKGGSPDCEFYFPATSDNRSIADTDGMSRGQNFEEFINGIYEDIRQLLIQARLIQENSFDDRLMRLIKALVDKELRNFIPSLKTVELAGLAVLKKSAESSHSEKIASLILEFYSRDRARFIDGLFCQWVLYYIYCHHKDADIAVALNRLAGDEKQLSDIAGAMIVGLALMYSKEDLSRYSDELSSRLTEFAYAKDPDAPEPSGLGQEHPICQGTFWTNCFAARTYSSGEGYVGEWKDNKWHGKGTYTWPNGAKYVGAFKGGKYDGEGVLTFSDGQKYAGAFRDDKFNGEGMLTSSGEKYAGTFRDGKFNGEGTYTWPSGQKYIGSFKDGRFNGEGTFTSSDGKKYVGEFRDDIRNGQGTLALSDGRQYVGEFRYGKPNGQGTYTWPIGRMYVGEFKNGKRHGLGAEFNAKGKVLNAGMWIEDKLVK